MTKSKDYVMTKRIGGPGTFLPAAMESMLGWALAMSCLLVSAYHYGKCIGFQKLNWLPKLLQWFEKAGPEESWLPLTTYTTNELQRCSSEERLSQLLKIVLKYAKDQGHSIEELADDELVRIIRNDETSRRLATLAFHPQVRTSKLNTEQKTLEQRLRHLWPRLLALPHLDQITYSFEISVILPCYREKPSDVHHRLQMALANCAQPKQIQVLIVNAGLCDDLDAYMNKKGVDGSRASWGSLTILAYRRWRQRLLPKLWSKACVWTNPHLLPLRYTFTHGLG